MGSGAYGSVLLGTDLCTSSPVAIKFIADGRMRPASLDREVNLLRRLSDANHPALVKFHAHVRPSEASAGEVRAHGALPLSKPLGSYHALVMELARGGELFDYVVKANGLKERESAPICAQLCDAVRAAHSLGIAHRDLKLENVLLVGQRGDAEASRIKLIDWGLAHQHEIDVHGRVLPERLRSRCGSRSYMAPEVANRELSAKVGYNGFAADVWSLGVCLFAIHLGFFPFEQADPEQDWRARRVVTAQRGGKSTMETILTFYPQRPGNRLSKELCALIDRMLVFDAAKRASLTEVLSSEWLAPHVAICNPDSPLTLAYAQRSVAARTAQQSLTLSDGSSCSEGACTAATVAAGAGLGRGHRRTGSGGTGVTLSRAERQSSATSTCTERSSAVSSASACSGIATHRMLYASPPSYLPPSSQPFVPSSSASPSARGRCCTGGEGGGGDGGGTHGSAPEPVSHAAVLARHVQAVRTARAQAAATLEPKEPEPVVVVAGGAQHETHKAMMTMKMGDEGGHESATMMNVPTKALRRSYGYGDEEATHAARDKLAYLFAKKCKLARSRSARDRRRSEGGNIVAAPAAVHVVPVGEVMHV